MPYTNPAAHVQLLASKNAALKAENDRLLAGVKTLLRALTPIITQASSQCSPNHSGSSPIKIEIKCDQFRTIAVVIAALNKTDGE